MGATVVGEAWNDNWGLVMELMLVTGHGTVEGDGSWYYNWKMETQLGMGRGTKAWDG
jgi:hypothetical protein